MLVGGGVSAGNPIMTRSMRINTSAFVRFMGYCVVGVGEQGREPNRGMYGTHHRPNNCQCKGIP